MNEPRNGGVDPGLLSDFGLDTLEDLSKLSAYGKRALGAWQFTKELRFKHFLGSLDAATGAQTLEQRRRLDDYLKSPEGLRVLGDFVDAATRTSSITALSALALLCADASALTYGSDFKSSTCEALDGITERTVDVFMAVMKDHSPIQQSKWSDPYPVFSLTQLVTDSAAFRELLPNPALQMSAVRALVRRGVLEEDFKSNRMGDDEHYGGWLGVSQYSVALHQLLTTAREQLRIGRGIT